MLSIPQILKILINAKDQIIYNYIKTIKILNKVEIDRQIERQRQTERDKDRQRETKIDRDRLNNRKIWKRKK